MSLDKGRVEQEREEEVWPSLASVKEVPAPSVDEDERMAELGKKFDLPGIESRESHN